MTRDDILNMPAGREMNRLVMEWVTELTVDDNFYIPAYSTDIAAAWEVVAKMGNVNELHDVELRTSIRGWICSIFNSFDNFEVNAETAPLAICRAALLAVMDGGQ